MGWDGERGETEGGLVLRRYDVQVFVWATLPRKFLASLEDKLAGAGALATLLERLGGRAAEYAEVCRAPETGEMIRAWEDEDESAPRRYRDLMDGSGLEPPDTALLAWGFAMGVEEATARDQLATVLEREIEAGRLTPDTPGFRRRQVKVTEEALLAPSDWQEMGPAEDDGLDADCPERENPSRLDAILMERLERWRARGAAFGREERSAIIDPVAPLIGLEPPALDPEDARAALGPTLWLLGRAEEGIALTQKNALSRAFVREVAERYPHWWDAELFGPPHRETDVTLLSELDDLLRATRLLRRRGRRIFATKRARGLVADPPTLLRVLTVELLAGESFDAACAEFAVALVIDGAAIEYGDGLAERVQPAIAADGWRAGDDPPDVRDVSWAIAYFLRPAEAIGLIERGERTDRRGFGPQRLTPARRPALLAALRARAIGPSHRP